MDNKTKSQMNSSHDPVLNLGTGDLLLQPSTENVDTKMIVIAEHATDIGSETSMLVPKTTEWLNYYGFASHAPVLSTGLIAKQ